MSDPVNSPAHYTAGRYEAIDVIEDAVQHAPDPVVGGLQWLVLPIPSTLSQKSSLMVIDI